MKKYKYLVTLVFSLFLFNSCEDDLNTVPEDDDIVNLETSSDYLSFLAGIYANLSNSTQTDTNAGASPLQGIDGGTSTFSRTMWYMQTITTDEAIWSFENDAGTPELNRNTWNDTNVFSLGVFARMGTSLAFATELLRSSEGVTDEQIANITLYRAEARFLRALAYYYYLDLFNKAPLVTVGDLVSASFKPPQIEGQALFDLIVSELTTAIEDLPNPGQNQYGRADKAAAWMILAKLYLNSEVYTGTARYNEAVDQCNNIINSGAYMLNPVYDNNFTADNHLSPEIIFPIISDGNSVQNFGATTVIINGEPGNLEMNGLTQVGVDGFGGGGGLRMRSQLSEVLLTAAAGDRNTISTIMDPSRGINIINPIEPSSGFITTKFKNLTSDGSLGSTSGVNAFVDTDLPLFRLGDVYLMYAEAVWRGASNGNMTQAIQYINDLRDRANAPFISTLTEEILFNERTIEMHWEGHRRQDLRRFGRFTGNTYLWDWKGNVAAGTAIPEHFGLFPLHAQQTLSANPNLTQNPGY